MEREPTRELTTREGTIEIYSVKGKSFPKNKNNQDSSPPIAVLAQGFSEEVDEHNRESVDALAARGINAMAYGQPPRTKEVEDSIEERAHDLRSAIEVGIPDPKQEIALLGHSLGAAAAIRYALEAPDELIERISSITILQSAGMVGGQSITELGRRSGKKTIKSLFGAIKGQGPDKNLKEFYQPGKDLENEPEDDKSEKDGTKEKPKYDIESGLQLFARVGRAVLASGGIFKQPILSIREASAAAKYDIVDDIIKLHKKHPNLPINVVVSNGDELFPSNEVYDTAEKIAALTNSITFASVADREAEHDFTWKKPKQFAATVEELIH